jgi:hypothetical protein
MTALSFIELTYFLRRTGVRFGGTCSMNRVRSRGRLRKNKRPVIASIQGIQSLIAALDCFVTLRFAMKDRRKPEQVPKKFTDFFDQNLLQLIDFERSLIDHMIPRDREAL